MSTSRRIGFLVRAAASTLALASVALAQTSTRTAHPQETLQNSNGNLVPFGVTSSGNVGEGRTMMLVPKHELPTVVSVLVGIEVHAQATAPLTYATLALRCAPTTAPSLQSTFASNYTTAPTPVLQATNLTVPYASNAWVQIPFTAPYVHDGSSALLIEIQKVVQQAAGYPFLTMSTTSSPPRTDRPNMICAFGTIGSGASNATTAPITANALSFRLVWQGTPALRNRSDVGTSGAQYNVGGSVTLTVDGSAGHVYVLAAATGFLGTQVPVPGIAGALVLNGPVLFTSGVLDALGAGVFVVSIPNNPALSGFHLSYQGATIDPSSVAVTLTNGTDHFVNP